ncbi:unnamed protein product [Anisakis simplex]|uniref:Muscle LIM protein Mlp84B (inferred by orthology to a human protein) n=1 Tax=Anisakis simplex TaxID=6269 RepID=A0A0M3J779_ANISI|nr:unnamed protein product [Anisakis simplex]
MCNKLLDSTSCCEHQVELYCRQCYGRKYGPKGVGFGLGAGALTMDTGEQFGNTEVEMTKNGNSNEHTGVYALPQTALSGMCNKLLDSCTIAQHGSDLFCKQCYGRKHGPKGVGFGLGAGALTMDDGARFGNTSTEMGSDGKPLANDPRYSMLESDAGKQTAPKE